MEIVRPTLVINKNKCIRNIKKIQNKIKNTKIVFRPHFKTHQSKTVGELYRGLGIDKITVSSVDMAIYFYKNYWDDITIAFPFNILEINKVNKELKQCKLSLIASDIETLLYLNENLEFKVNLYLELDFGLNRSGIKADDFANIEKFINKAKESKKINFIGFLTHNGETYNVKGIANIKQIYEKTILQIKKIKKYFGDEYIFSIGDTPIVSTIEVFDDVIDEIRPGNFVYYDLMQYEIGVCSLDEISSIVYAPVVSKYDKERKIVLYCGAVHLSKDSLVINGKNVYGRLVLDGDITSNYIERISQEHSIVNCAQNDFNKLKIGDLVGIIPIHSCLTADLLKDHTYFDDGAKIDVMR
ncbi:MAG TPA: alanine racemase [Bacilli bacterium]|nr:alanine racemase [Bacilli bacterium]